ncbi:SSI family serine proteinase inhibitor [Kutzneria sp. CA-103260]|uniref:SSI family serine proteinase inhibitor n=1 Tax=Kutzneria sp. CA-103260 TaxID=2802641 RepID=UPI001BAC6687|nr:SSI family serine proteinase inhibitor [Kutzneria sp. CA-103260]
MAERPAVAVPHAVGPAYTEYVQLTAVTGVGDKERRQTRLLRCDPVGGDHPHAQAACRDITAAAGDFDRLPGDPVRGVCGAGSALYDPVTVSATGTWDGATVDYRKTFVNQCRLRLATGLVFDL